MIFNEKNGDLSQSRRGVDCNHYVGCEVVYSGRHGWTEPLLVNGRNQATQSQRPLLAGVVESLPQFAMWLFSFDSFFL